MRALFILLLCVMGGTAGAQTLTIGPQFPAVLNGGISSGTVVDISSPAPADGTIDTVRYALSFPCGVKIKFFRRSGNTFTMIAERGPFNGVPDADSSYTVTLSPPVNVQSGDVIGLADAGGGCASPLAFCFVPSPSYVTFASDVTGTVTAEDFGHCTMALRGTGSATTTADEIIRAVIPVAGSAPGNNGAFFRTSVQVSHRAEPGAGTITGRLMFHPAGSEGSDADPSVNFTLRPGEVKSWYDLVETMGIRGTGSIDVLMSDTQPLPLISVRIFNDAGAAGTSGMNAPPVFYATEVIFDARIGYLITPIDPVQTRYNIGARTLDAAQVTYELLDPSGTTIASTTRSYPPHFFEQVTFDSMFGPLPAGGRLIRITSSGQVIVYGAAVDNKTNDPALQLATIVDHGF